MSPSVGPKNKQKKLKRWARVIESTMGREFALYAVDPISIPGILFGTPSPPGVITEHCQVWPKIKSTEKTLKSYESYENTSSWGDF